MITKDYPQLVEPTSEWRDIPRLPGYAVTSDGDILSRWANNQTLTPTFQRYRVLSPDKDGYLQVSIYSKTLRVHHLVLLAFVGPCPPGLEGCHNNGVVT